MLSFWIQFIKLMYKLFQGLLFETVQWSCIVTGWEQEKDISFLLYFLQETKLVSNLDNIIKGVYPLSQSQKCSVLWMTTQTFYFFKHRFLVLVTRPKLSHYIKSLYVDLMESYNTWNCFNLRCIYLQRQLDLSLLFQITMTKPFWGNS